MGIYGKKFCLGINSEFPLVENPSADGAADATPATTYLKARAYELEKELKRLKDLFKKLMEKVEELNERTLTHNYNNIQEEN